MITSQFSYLLSFKWVVGWKIVVKGFEEQLPYIYLDILVVKGVKISLIWFSSSFVLPAFVWGVKLQFNILATFLQGLLVANLYRPRKQGIIYNFSGFLHCSNYLSSYMWQENLILFSSERTIEFSLLVRFDFWHKKILLKWIFIWSVIWKLFD